MFPNSPPEGFDLAVNFLDRLQAVIDSNFSGIKRRLALKAKVDVNTIQAYFKRGSAPGYEIAKKLADAAEVNVEWLIEGEGPREIMPRTEANDSVSESTPAYRSKPLSDRQSELLELDSKADPETRRYVRYLLPEGATEGIPKKASKRAQE